MAGRAACPREAEDNRLPDLRNIETTHVYCDYLLRVHTSTKLAH